MPHKINYEQYETPSDFLKVKEGTTIIKLISDGFILKEHAMKFNGVFTVLGECTGAGCEFCMKGDPKLMYVWIVLDRTKKRVRVLKVGKNLGDKICKAVKNNKLEGEFDIQIDRKGMSMRDTQYKVSTIPSREIDKVEDEMIIANKQLLLKKYIL